VYLTLSVPTFGQGASTSATPPAPQAATQSDAGVRFPLPRLTVEVGNTEDREDVSLALQILFVLTVLSLAPSILVLTTGFTRMIIVLSLTRSAMGTQQMPPNAVLIGLALFLTLFVMAPVGSKINEKALGPYLRGEITFQDGVKEAEGPLRDFMFRQTRRKDLGLFINVARIEGPQTKDDVPTYVLIPAFVISELKTAFEMGFLIYLPFLIIDMVDGWHLITRSLILSFN
jgi:flagellar biosynthetic protein FliP